MTGVFLALLSLTAGEPTQADWDWLSEHRDRAFEALMPVEEQPGAYVAFRSYRDLYQEVPEQYFMIRDELSRLQGVAVAPVGDSIQQQMLDAHMVDRQLPFEKILALVKVRTVRIDATSCPAMGKAIVGLDKLRFGTPDRGTIVIHPVVHRLVIEYSAGRFNGMFYEDDHPVARWARDAYSRLAKCAGLVVEAH